MIDFLKECPKQSHNGQLLENKKILAIGCCSNSHGFAKYDEATALRLDHFLGSQIHTNPAAQAKLCHPKKRELFSSIEIITFNHEDLNHIIKMEYKVVPFVAAIDQKKGTSNHVAEQLEQLINEYSSYGWNYVRLESVTTFVGPDNGCFGFGGKPSYTTTRQMIVFSK